MTATFKLVDDLGRKTGFKTDTEVLVDIPAGRITGSLGILDIVENAHHHLDMTLGLHVSAHDPEAHQRLIISGHESRNDGVSKRRIAALGRKGIIAAFPFSPEKYPTRADKDLLADTNE